MTLIESARADLRYAIRWLLRSPGFSLVAVASLAIGTGFNTALFSVVDAALLRPLPVERPERLVDVYTRGADGDTYSTSSYPDYQDLRERNQVFGDLMAYSAAIGALRTGDRARLALGEVVSGNYFEVLGVRPAAGRLLEPPDDRSGAGRVVVISHRLWRREYAASPDAIGRTLYLRNEPYTIVGVASAQFTGMIPVLQPEIWTPLAWVDDVEPAGIQDGVPSPGNTRLERRGQRWLFMKGRLKDGETIDRAEANLQVVMRQLADEWPATNKDRPIAVASTATTRIHPQADRMLRPIAIGLMVAVGLVLLVACANVASMLLARASGRQREIGIRLAIGASRGRLVRQLLTESLTLAIFGGAAGVALAYGLLRLLQAIPVPLPVPVELALQIDSRVLAFTLAVAAGAGIVAGFAPAWKATRPNMSAELKGDVAATPLAGRRWSLRDGLVALQTAVTLVLLVTAGLLTRSILAAQHVDLGFRPGGLVTVSTELGLIGYDEARTVQYFERVVERLRALPGIERVTQASRQPLAVNYSRNSIFFPDRQPPGDPAIPISVVWIDEEYLATLAVPLLQGRNIAREDTPESPRVAVVNETFARRYWPDEDPIGRRFRLRGADGPEIQIVGVCADYKVSSVGEPPTPYIHYALRQSPSNGGVLVVRTAGDAGAQLVRIQREMLALEPGAVFLDQQTMETQVGLTLLPARLAAQAVGLVGAVATGLAAIGLYGVVAYGVARRTREIGIRMALGAAPGSVLALVMRQGLAVAVAGLAVGAVLAWVATRALAAALYGVGATDPLAWAGATGVLLTAVLLANYIPARRAARIDPTTALRTD